MKRAAIFAFYDSEKIINDYVIYYLKELKKVCEHVVFVSCVPLADNEKSRINGLANVIIDEEHNEYDFGSYKRGYLYLKNNNLLQEFDELTLCNDSCYGPFYKFSEIYNEMETKDCDFWGITKNNFGYRKDRKHFFVKRPHIQSYFIVFNNEIFSSEFFSEFFENIKEQIDKKSVVSNYEIGLSEMIVAQGFKYDVLVNAYGHINNVTILKWRQIIQKYKMPFIKKSLVELRNTDAATVQDFKEVISKISSYPIHLFIQPRKIKRIMPLFVKRLVFDTLANFPFIVRKPFAILINKLFVFLKD